MTNSDRVRVRGIVAAFRHVEHVPFASGVGRADDWRESSLRSLNCSVFAQWLALRCLGWGKAERDDPSLSPASASFLYHASRFPSVSGESALPGDLCLYRDPADATAFHCMVYLGWSRKRVELVVGACENEQRMLVRPVCYERRWILSRIRRIAR